MHVIFTGGTIGSLSAGNNINTNSQSHRMLIDMYNEMQKSNCKDTSKFKEREFIISEPINILSENAVLDDVILMAKSILKANEEQVNDSNLKDKGIIVTHGSDTLAYSSCLLALLISNLIKVPVVMVASNLILTNPDANGVYNFTAAVDLCLNKSEKIKPAVYVAYKNPEDDFTSIHLATRMDIPGHMSDSFYSPQGFRFAKYKNGSFEFENTNFEITNYKFNFNLDGKKAKGLFIEPMTGLDYSTYDNIHCDFVLHNLYHSGTANTNNDKKYENNNLLIFAKNLNQRKIPLYLCNIKKKDINYDSTNQLLKNGIRMIYNTLANVAYSKLEIAYSLLNVDERERFLNDNIAGEYLK